MNILFANGHGRRRALGMALRMGHCAPSVMAALTDDADPEREEAIFLSSTMAGGVGNSGLECGALTSSILTLGRRYGRSGGAAAPAILLSHRLIRRFRKTHGGTHCTDIRR